jgi:ribonuclease HI
MKQMKELLLALARGGSVRGEWRRAGFASEEEAAQALRDLAMSVSGPRASGKSAGARRRSPPVSRKSPPDLVVYVDGASRGNPGPSSVGAIAYLPGGEELTSVSKPIGRATNNVAEYRAVLEGMRLARKLGAEIVEIRLDSELVARQLNGEYKIKNKDLLLLSQAVFSEAALFATCRYVHIPRAENRRADGLASEALERRASDG